jgi:hypothetical protein
MKTLGCLLFCTCLIDACGGFIFHFTEMNDTSWVIINNAEKFKFPSNTQYPTHLTVDWESSTQGNVNAYQKIDYNLH